MKRSVKLIPRVPVAISQACASARVQELMRLLSPDSWLSFQCESQLNMALATQTGKNRLEVPVEALVLLTSLG